MSWSASAAFGACAESRQRIAAQDSGLMTLYHAFSWIRTRLPTPMASAPPLPPSPITAHTAGTLRRTMRWMLSAIAQACPRSSASMPGYAPGVSMSATTGRRNLSARSMSRIALR